MINIGGPPVRLCDGVTRRRFLQVGAIGQLGLALPQLLAPRAAGAAEPRADACILLWLQGGPSQIETFDPKPDAPPEIRGPFRPIETNVGGIQIAEIFPLLARQAHHYALIRSVHHPNPSHIVGHQYMLCGMGNPGVAYPSMASVVTRLKGARSLLPANVMAPNIAYETNATPEKLCQNAGYLGRDYDPILPHGSLVEGRLTLENLDPPARVAAERAGRRRTLLDSLEPAGFSATTDGQTASALYRKAFDLMDGEGVRTAFDLTREPEKLRRSYGLNHVGQGALLARRLVGAGTRFVTVNWPNRLAWDTHTDLEGQMRLHLAPALDRALSTLLTDLADRGMLERTMVIAMGEMGRTPKIGNPDPRFDDGRDHWSSVMSVLIAGGGVRGGQVVGASDAEAAYPSERPVASHDLVASVYHAFGIHPDDTVPTVSGQPKKVLEQGAPVLELF